MRNNGTLLIAKLFSRGRTLANNNRFDHSDLLSSMHCFGSAVHGCKPHPMKTSQDANLNGQEYGAKGVDKIFFIFRR